MAFLCTPPSGATPVTVEAANRAETFAARGYIVTDLDAVEADNAEPAPEKPRPARKPKASAPE